MFKIIFQKFKNVSAPSSVEIVMDFNIQLTINFPPFLILFLFVFLCLGASEKDDADDDKVEPAEEPEPSKSRFTSFKKLL